MEFNLEHNPNRKVIQESLPSGTYFIGDIFYGLKNKYVDIVYENIEEGVLTLEEDGKEYTLVFDKVFGGKNRYNDCYDHEYEIESEYLGIIPIELCDLSNNDDDVNEIGQKIEFDEMIDVYIVDGIFIFHWVSEKSEDELGNHNGFLKIDTKNADVPILDEHEYNDVSYEEFVFRTRDENERKNMYTIDTIQENVEDYDDVEKSYEDNELGHIDPNIVEVRYLDTFRN
jgi:hypothetical protein